jgi:hypothetical protein
LLFLLVLILFSLILSIFICFHFFLLILSFQFCLRGYFPFFPFLAFALISIYFILFYFLPRSEFEEFKSIKNSFSAPKRISKLLKTLSSVRASILLIFDLSPKDVEDSAWLVLNGCKIIYLIGDPLIWHW